MTEKDIQLIRNTCRNVNVVCFLWVLWFFARGLWSFLETVVYASQMPTL